MPLRIRRGFSIKSPSKQEYGEQKEVIDKIASGTLLPAADSGCGCDETHAAALGRHGDNKNSRSLEGDRVSSNLRSCSGQEWGDQEAPFPGTPRLNLGEDGTVEASSSRLNICDFDDAIGGRSMRASSQ